MQKVKKRIFAGNLPSKITESSVRQKFSKFGVVSSIEIKTSSDVAVPSCYAFLDLETDAKRLDSCFETLSKEQWNGLPMKLELAKESFLTRLQREREETNTKSSEGSTPNDTRIPTEKSYNFVTSAYSQSSHQNKKKHFDDDDDDDVVENKPVSVAYDHQKAVSLTTNIPASKESKTDSLLQKFESFSDVWKDEPTFVNQKKKRNYERVAERDSFEVVPQKHKDSKSDYFPIKNESRLTSNKTNSSEQKRLKSVEERKRTFLHQKEAVKLALASVDSRSQHNKRIIFDDDVLEESGTTGIVEPSQNSHNSTLKGQRGPQLFENDDVEEDHDYDFNIRKKYEGKKGKRLLDLQSRYANDKRFTLDDRFYESDDSGDNGDEGGPPVVGSVEEERMKQLEILQSIVGDNLPHSYEEKKAKTSIVDNMVVHYDPTIDDHAKYEIKEEKAKKVAPSLNTRQERRLDERRAKKKQKKDLLTPVLPAVSQEKFYKVSESLKESLKSDGKSFSLLETFGSMDDKKEFLNNEDSYSCITTNNTRSQNLLSNPFKWDSSDSEDEVENPFTKPASSLPDNQSHVDTLSGAQSMWRENFFLRADDERLSEGLKFFSEGGTSSEDFSQHRRHVQKILSAKVRKNIHRTSLKTGRGGRRGRGKKFMKR